MEIASPKEPVYYYECSAGRYRLAYFIPPGELQRLHDEGQISDLALEDLPDGVDLSCTEPDFAEFKELYGYRPPYDPDALLRAFFAVFSTTRKWKSFRGSGFIPAKDLEMQMEMVEEELEAAELEHVDLAPPPATATPKQRKSLKIQQTAQQKRIRRAIKKRPAKGIDPRKSLRQQEFSKITMGEGKTAEEVFSELYLKQKS
jgi:hypothetical protein